MAGLRAGPARRASREAEPGEGHGLEVEVLPRARSVRAWGLAARPATLWAGAAPVAAGTGAAAGEGAFAPLPAAGALVVALALQVAANLANDADDHERGADAGGRAGPLRAAQAGLLPPRALRAGALGALALAGAAGLALAAHAGAWLLVPGALAALAGYAYTGGPALGYRGLGDALVLVFFGLVAVTGTHYVQAQQLSPVALAAGLPVGLLATTILAVNNLRDLEGDARAGKRTLAVRLGARGARRYARALPVAAFAALPLLPLAGAGAAAALLPLAAAPGAWGLVRRLGRAEGTQLNPLLGAAARLEALFALLLALGLALGERPLA